MPIMQGWFLFKNVIVIDHINILKKTKSITILANAQQIIW